MKKETREYSPLEDSVSLQELADNLPQDWPFPELTPEECASLDDLPRASGYQPPPPPVGEYLPPPPPREEVMQEEAARARLAARSTEETGVQASAVSCNEGTQTSAQSGTDACTQVTPEEPAYRYPGNWAGTSRRVDAAETSINTLTVPAGRVIPWTAGTNLALLGPLVVVGVEVPRWWAPQQLERAFELAEDDLSSWTEQSEHLVEEAREMVNEMRTVWSQSFETQLDLGPSPLGSRWQVTELAEEEEAKPTVDPTLTASIHPGPSSGSDLHGLGESQGARADAFDDSPAHTPMEL